MPPDHPYPAGLDDCMAFYKSLLRDHSPAEIIVGGGSAGANLAAALMLRVRDEGLPLPAAVILSSPEIDLTESGDSFHTNAGIDGMGTLMQANLLYAAGTPLDHPYVSALFGDFTKGFPPTFLTAGTRDLFLSNAVRFHRALRAAGVPAELHILEAAAHGAFGGGSPEEAELDRETRRFCDEAWQRG
jgi:acetyl esterase/lipase